MEPRLSENPVFSSLQVLPFYFINFIIVLEEELRKERGKEEEKIKQNLEKISNVIKGYSLKVTIPIVS